MLRKGFRVGEYVSSGKVLGKGAFATVYLGRHSVNTDNVVAIKVVDAERLEKKNPKLRDHLDSEIIIMTRLVHPNIVKLHNVYPDEDGLLYMILEYCAVGDFAAYLNGTGPLSEVKARYFLKQLAEGMQYLREFDIVHRDLKPQNLLLSRDGTEESLVLKIADFGFARFIEPESVASTICGSPLYMAPEILQFLPYSNKSDLWSIGAIFYQMITGEPPFNVKTQYELLRLLQTKEVCFPTDCSDECGDLLKGLLTKDPERRLDWHDLFAHPFLADHALAESHCLASPVDFSPLRPIASPTMRPKRASTMPHLPSISILGTSPTEDSVLVNTIPKNLDAMFEAVASNDSFSDFEMIEKSGGSASELVEKRRIDDIEQHFSDVEAVAKLANIKSNQAPVEAVVLYIHTLRQLRSLVLVARDLKMKGGFRDSPRLDKIVAEMYREFQDCLTQADFLRRNQVRASDTAHAAPKLMYEYAIQMGLEAAVDEILGNNQKSKWMYTNGHHILRQLLREATSEADKKILQSYIDAFSMRLRKLKLMGSA